MDIHKYRGKLEPLRKALNMMSRIEANDMIPEERNVLVYMSMTVDALKTLLITCADPVERSEILNTFEIINEIYYDKLEKDINTKH